MNIALRRRPFAGAFGATASTPPVIFVGTVNAATIAGELYSCGADPDSILTAGGVRAIDLLRCWLTAAKGMAQNIGASADAIAADGVAVNALQTPGATWNTIADAFTQTATALYNERYVANARIDGALATLAQADARVAPQIPVATLMPLAQATVQLIDALLSQRNEASSMATAFAGYAQKDIHLVAGDTTWATRAASVLQYFNVFGALTGIATGAIDVFSNAVDALAKGIANVLGAIGKGAGSAIGWTLLPILGIGAGVVVIAAGGFYLYKRAGGAGDIRTSALHGPRRAKPRVVDLEFETIREFREFRIMAGRDPSKYGHELTTATGHGWQLPADRQLPSLHQALKLYGGRITGGDA